MHRAHTQVAASLSMFLGFAVLSPQPLQARQALTERISVGVLGQQAGPSSAFSDISADGQFVAFGSLAPNLILTDNNGVTDIFVFDRINDFTTRVSVSSSGAQGNSFSTNPAISGNGRFVSFLTSATNLFLGDTNGLEDVFVHEFSTGQTTRISTDLVGAEANGASGNRAI